MLDLKMIDLTDGMTTPEKLFWFACTIGLSSTAVRLCSGTKNDWWIWAILIHGFTLFYALRQCDGGADFQLPEVIHNSFCCEDCEITGYSNTERWIMFILALLGIGVNVVPKYWKGDEAVRHMVHVKKAKIVNPLLFHIVCGILTVVMGGVMSLSSSSVQNDKLMLGLLALFDIGHNISIHRLLKNHDGIWTLRAGNMQLAVMKWIVLLRVGNPQTMIDMLFFQSCGFLGTRIFTTIVYILMYFGVPTKLIEEDWYSIGLAGAQFWIYARFWDVAAPVVWLSIVSCGALYFHQLWRNYLHLRNVFVLLNCAAMALALSLPTYLSFAFTLAYWCSFFLVPGFKRQPLMGHLKSTISSYKKAKSAKHSERQHKLMKRARKSLSVGKICDKCNEVVGAGHNYCRSCGNPLKSKSKYGRKSPSGMKSMMKFLTVAEFRRSMRASAMMLQGLSASLSLSSVTSIFTSSSTSSARKLPSRGTTLRPELLSPARGVLEAVRMGTSCQ